MAVTQSNEYYTTEEYEDYDDYESQTCDIINTMEFGKIFTPVFFSIIVVLSVIGNTLVIIILIKYENLKSITNAFIMNLAISDLLFTTGLPFWVHYDWKGAWDLGEAACKSVNFVFYIGFYSSGLFLILMTIHRYIAVVNPLSDVVSAKGLYCVLAPILVWFVSAVIAVPHAIFTQLMSDGFCGYVTNSPLSFWGIYQQIALFILTSLIFIFCYSQIIWRLVRPTGQRRKSKTLKVIFTLMIVYFIGWAPYNVVIFLQSNNGAQKANEDEDNMDNGCKTFTTLEYALNISRFGAYSHCCLNPVFYVFVGVKFKNHLMRFVKDLGRSNNSKRNGNSVRSHQSRMTVTSITSGEEMSL